MVLLQRNRMLVISLLTVLTALIHLYIGIGSLGEGGILFILNFGGYLALLGVYLYNETQLDGKYWQSRLVLGLYTVITIIAYFASWGLEPFVEFDAVGLGTKLIEVLLIVSLIYDARIQTNQSS